MRSLGIALVIVAGIGAAPADAAEKFPTRPIRMLVRSTLTFVSEVAQCAKVLIAAGARIN